MAIDKETILGMARDGGLAGPEIVELRALGGGVSYWLYAGSAGNRAFVMIDPAVDSAAEVRDMIGELRGIPRTRGNTLLGEPPLR